MRFLFTMGRLVVFDFRLFEIDDDSDPEVIVIRHDDDDNGDNDPGDLFGKGK